MKTKEKISQMEVSAALQKFIKEGGIIRHLPDQEYKCAQTIGEDKYQIYESISDLSAVANPGETPQ